MAYPSEHNGLRSNGALRLALVLLAVFFVGYCIVGPKLKESSNAAQASCSCDCDCSDEFGISWPIEFINNSYADCGNNDPNMSEEMQKNIVSLLSEEILLAKEVSEDILEQSMKAITNASILSSHFQSEVRKCTAQIETCEEARERAEEHLVEERKLTALWEKRALEFGWRDRRRVYV